MSTSLTQKNGMLLVTMKIVTMILQSFRKNSSDISMPNFLKRFSKMTNFYSFSQQIYRVLARPNYVACLVQPRLL